MPTTVTLTTPESTLVYDVHGPLPAAAGRPPLLMVGQPMCADGFETLASYFPDRTVVAYDVRGLGRSTRQDGRDDHTPVQNAADVHAIIDDLGGGPVEIFGSSGGAVTVLELLRAYPGDVSVAVAHEPPVVGVLPDAATADEAFRRVTAAYEADGFGAGMAAFIALTSWTGELTDDFLAQPLPDPSMFGMPTADDGSRGDPLLAGSGAVVAYRPDLDALRASTARLVVGAGEESAEQLPGRAAAVLAGELGQPLLMFPSHHGGFQGGDGPYAGQPEAFATTLRKALAGS